MQASNDPAQCSMPCVGNHSEFCGGPDALNIYMAKSDPPSPSDNCLPPRSDGYGMLANGGFESGFATWTPSVLQGEFAFDVDTAHNYEGCNAA